MMIARNWENVMFVLPMSRDAIMELSANRNKKLNNLNVTGLCINMKYTGLFFNRAWQNIQHPDTNWKLTC